MPDYTHPNGYTVERDADGRVILDRDGDAWVTPETAAALRDFFLAELGLWRDDETGALVMTTSWDEGRQEAQVIRDGRAWLVGDPTQIPEWELTLLGADKAQEDWEPVTRWRATLTPPPREPKPGEVWRITLADGSEYNALVGVVATGAPVWRTEGEGVRLSTYPPDRRRLLVEADGTVVSDE